MRYEVNVIINGSRESVKEFVKILNRANRSICDEGCFSFKGKSYEFSSEYEYEYEIVDNNIFNFDFTDCGSSMRYNSLIEFLQDMSSKDLTFYVLTFTECTEEMNAMFICKGQCMIDEGFTDKMKDAEVSFDWENNGFDNFINYLTKLSKHIKIKQ